MGVFFFFSHSIEVIFLTLPSCEFAFIICNALNKYAFGILGSGVTFCIISL